MEKFLVYQEWTSSDDFGVEPARWILASNARLAAEKYMEAYHHNMDYAPKCILRIGREGDTSCTRWRVEVRSIMQAHAEQIDRDPNAKGVQS